MPSQPTQIEPIPGAFFAPEALAELCRLPKCNIHTHLEGSIRPSTLAELAAEQGIPLPVSADRSAGTFRVGC